MKSLSLVFLLAIVVLIAACDADKELDKAFASNGLTRINAPRTDYSPGTVILKGKARTIPAGNISDYVTKSSLTVIDQDRTNDVSAILPKLTVTKNINPSLAVNFITSAIPLSGTANLKFTSNVDLDQMNCKVDSIKIIDLQNFLKDTKNAPLAAAFAGFAKEKAEIYIAYEVWKASTLNFSSSTGTDIDTDVKAGEVKPLLESGDLKFTYSKTVDKSLKVSGDQFYPFALRLARVTVNPATTALTVTFTDFKLNFDVKAVADESYSALPNPDGAAITLTPVSRDQLLKVLQTN
jgi:hypothetical protein